MGEQDARSWLSRAQAELARGDRDAAYRSFGRAASAFAGPAQLLGGGHAWRGVAQVALSRGELDAANRAIAHAERMYALGAGLLHGGDETVESIRLDLVEGEATCQVLRADLALRKRDFPGVRRSLDAAYPLYKDLGTRSSVSDLWTTTARLAEREGRWFAARTAWEQALKVRRANFDEPGTCDALIRLVEAILADADLEAAEERLQEAEALARELEVPNLLGRVHVVRARQLELEHDWEGAWEKWLDAMQALEGADPVLVGLSRIRMARTAARVREQEVDELLQNGLSALLEGRYPDAVGLVLHQLAVVSLAREDFDVALLAATGAWEASRVPDPAVEGVLFRALMRVEEHGAAWLLARMRDLRRPESDYDKSIAWLEGHLDPGFPRPEDDMDQLRDAFVPVLHEAVRPLARARGLLLEEIGTRRAAAKLTSAPDHTLEPVPVLNAPAEELVRPVLTWVIREGELERYPINEGLNLLGRGADNAVRLAWDAKASRSHCALDYRGGRELYVTDLDSHHGVFLDGERVEGSTRVDGHTHLLIGETEFTLEWAVASARAAVAIPA